MIGTLNKEFREVTVVGAGIAGMLGAYYLDRNGYRVTLIEQSERAGGLIRTRHTDHGIAESAAQSQSLWRIRETVPEAQFTNVKHDVSVQVSKTGEFIERAGQRLAAPYPHVKPFA